MPSEQPLDVKFEIGHVLFIDSVGYSKLLISDQSEHLQKLKEIVWGTEKFRLAQAEGKLLRLPTGLNPALLLHFKNARLEWKRVLRPREAGEQDAPDLHA